MSFLGKIFGGGESNYSETAVPFADGPRTGFRVAAGCKSRDDAWRLIDAWKRLPGCLRVGLRESAYMSTVIAEFGAEATDLAAPPLAAQATVVVEKDPLVSAQVDSWVWVKAEG